MEKRASRIRFTIRAVGDTIHAVNGYFVMILILLCRGLKDRFLNINTKISRECGVCRRSVLCLV
jgi:hypothetical protein